MSKVITINNRGTLTLPKEMRDLLGISNSGQAVVEVTAEGILLRPCVTVPVELYSESRLAEFSRNNDAALADFKLKK